MCMQSAIDESVTYQQYESGWPDQHSCLYSGIEYKQYMSLSLALTLGYSLTHKHMHRVILDSVCHYMCCVYLLLPNLIAAKLSGFSVHNIIKLIQGNLGGVHKQVCVQLNIKVVFEGGVWRVHDFTIVITESLYIILSCYWQIILCTLPTRLTMVHSCTITTHTNTHIMSYSYVCTHWDFNYSKYSGFTDLCNSWLAAQCHHNNINNHRVHKCYLPVDTYE